MSETEQSEVAAEAAVEEPVAEAAPDTPAGDAEEVADVVVAPLETPSTALRARVFVCERGHRITSLWSTPTVCRAHVTRRDECGRPLYPIGELPEQVQKALNPLKASKKSSKK